VLNTNQLINLSRNVQFVLTFLAFFWS